MADDIEEFAEQTLGIKLFPYQKELLRKMKENPNLRVFKGYRSGHHIVQEVYQKFLEKESGNA